MDKIKQMGTQIVVVDNGFVYVGTVAIDPDFCLVTNARNVRVWGTTKGLGELRSGPTKKTELDQCGEVMIPFGRVVHMIKCTQDW